MIQHVKLPIWALEDSATRGVQQLGCHRRDVVDERTAFSHRLIALLNQKTSIMNLTERRARRDAGRV